MITLTIPEPVPSVNLLHGHHWSRKRSERIRWGWFVRVARVDAGLPKPTPPHKARVTITRHGARLLDPSNLAAGCKWLEDALVGEGFLIDDSPAHYEPIYRQSVGKLRKTTIEIEAMS